MKYISLVLLLSISLSKTFAQVDSMKRQLLIVRDSISNLYCCHEDSCNIPVRNVLPETLDSLFVPIFTTVILNSNDVINNGSAGSLVQDEKTGKLSLSYTHKIRFNKFFNIGVTAESTEGVWNLYTTNSWQNTLGLNISYTWVPGLNSQFFDPAKCRELGTKRNKFLDSLLVDYYTTLSLQISEINTLISAKQDTISVDSSTVYDPTTTPANFTIAKVRYIRVKKETDSLRGLVEKHAELVRSYRSLSFSKLLLENITKFEMKNDIFTGYKLNWWNFGFSFGNTQNKLYNDTLKTDSLIRFTVSDYERFRFFINFNHVRNSRKLLSFLSPGIALYNTNFLEKKDLKEIPFISLDSTGKKYVFSGDNADENLGSLDELKKDIWVLTPSIHYSAFFIFKKTLGIEVYGDYDLHLNKLKSVDFPDTYSLYAGVVFRVDSKQELSKATIALDLGFNDALVKKRAADYFSFRLRIGVPFNVIAKKKE